MKVKKFFRFILISVLLSLTLLPMFPVIASQVYQNTITDYSGLKNLAGWYPSAGENMTFPEGTTIYSVSVNVMKYGTSTPAYDTFVQVWEAEPPYTLLDSVSIGKYSDFSPSGEWKTAILSGGGLDVTAPVIVGLTSTWGVSTSYCKFGWNDSSGNMTMKNYSSGNWQAMPDKDFAYYVDYGQGSLEITTENVTNVDYNLLHGDYDATFNFTLDNDGGDNETMVAFYYKDSEDESWLWTNVEGTFSTGETGNTTLEHQFLANHTYNVFARATNTYGYIDGSTVNFTVEESEKAPVIQTLNYPIVVSTSNLSAVIYGQVLDYGGANVTGYFWWRQYGDTEWTLTDNTTDLMSEDIFSANITGLSLDTVYQFKAEGINDFGTGSGGIGSFTLAELTTPSIETLPATNITNNSAILSANLTDMGNDNTLDIYWQFRESGNIPWNKTAYYYGTELGQYNRLLTNLSPNTEYEFRAVADAYVLGSSHYIGYGDMLTFITLSDYSVPLITTGNVTWLDYGYVRFISYIRYDGGYPVVVYVQYREAGTVDWSITASSYDAVTDDNVWSYASDIKNNTIYEYQSVGTNEVGTSYGAIRTFSVVDNDIPSGVDDEEDNFLLDAVNDLKDSLHLKGIFGTWAFMGLLILISSLLFGTGFVVLTEAWQKTAVAFAWIVFTACIVGAFVLTGQLGVWPIVIAVSAVAVVAIVFTSIKLSGNNGV